MKGRIIAIIFMNALPLKKTNLVDFTKTVNLLALLKIEKNTYVICN